MAPCHGQRLTAANGDAVADVRLAPSDTVGCVFRSFLVASQRFLDLRNRYLGAGVNDGSRGSRERPCRKLLTRCHRNPLSSMSNGDLVGP